MIHHSDRGIQYCSTEYTNLLQQHNCQISMTQNSDPYENAIAERVNGILKTELISNYYKEPLEASRHIARCITIYNYRRRHSSLNWQVPEDVHKQYGLQKKTWKTIIINEQKQQSQMKQAKQANAQNIFFSYGATKYFPHTTTSSFTQPILG
ncbi:MAG: transposase [Chitinophagaceae bacterium]|nr:transposase [Chitinophagaceae bacterium]